MIEFVDGDINLDVLEIKDVIDVATLKEFLDNFALGINCAAVTVDRDGNEITAPSYYRPFCQNHIHASKVGDRRCAECHNRMGEEAARSGKPYIGPCHAGLIDFAAPIMIKGKHIGTVLGGQILDKQPDEAKIRSVAEQIGANANGLWKAAQGIDIVQTKNIESSAKVLHIVVNALAENGYRQLVTENLSTQLADNFIQISETVEILANSAQDITEDQHLLATQISGINNTITEITTVLHSIEKIASSTNMIGLNAAIEAARLGDVGRGFAVVAKEIQNLSQQSKETTVTINKMNKEIMNRINETIAKANNTLKITEDQSAAMEELSATTIEVTSIAERLKTL